MYVRAVNFCKYVNRYICTSVGVYLSFFVICYSNSYQVIELHTKSEALVLYFCQVLKDIINGSINVLSVTWYSHDYGNQLLVYLYAK